MNNEDLPDLKDDLNDDKQRRDQSSTDKLVLKRLGQFFQSKFRMAPLYKGREGILTFIKPLKGSYRYDFVEIERDAQLHY